MDAVLEPVTSHAHALDLSGGDPWVRWNIPVQPSWRMWRSEHALAVERMGRRHSLTIIPLPAASDPDEAVAELATQASRDGIIAEYGIAGLSVPQASLGAVQSVLDLHPGGDWDWMWTTTTPVNIPGADRVVELDDVADAEEIAALSAHHSPTSEGEPGTGVSERWVGVRDLGGDLTAAGAMQRLGSGIPHLAGIVVHSDHRGTGLGLAVTAGLTEIGLADSGVCTLGMYSDNGAARRTYERCGYATAWAWASRRLHP